MTEAKTADINAGRKIKFKKGDIVVFDRGYNDYEWFSKLTSNDVFFVTRLKKDADYTVLKRTPVKKKGKITSDQMIRINKTGLILRRIGLKDKETGNHYKFLTNNFQLEARLSEKYIKTAGLSKSSFAGSNRISRSRPL